MLMKYATLSLRRLNAPVRMTTSSLLPPPAVKAAYDALCSEPPTPPLSNVEKLANHRLITELYAFTESGSKRKSLVRSSNYSVGQEKGDLVTSWKCNEWSYTKDPCPLPTLARGLFTRTIIDEARVKTFEIVARGYNKFFNIGQTKQTQVFFPPLHVCRG